MKHEGGKLCETYDLAVPINSLDPTIRITHFTGQLLVVGKLCETYDLAVPINSLDPTIGITQMHFGDTG